MQIFHITVATLVGAMTLAGLAIAMAPSKKATAVPIAQPAAAPVPQPPPLPVVNSNPLLDGCVISAIGRLPKADGLRVTNSSYELRPPNGSKFDFYTVSISVDLHGRQATYQWLCRVYQNSSAELLRMP